MATKETGLQFLARLGSRPSLSGLEPNIFGHGPRCKDAIEIFGEEGTCKTELLEHLIVRCILPEYWNNVHLEGHGAGVILIDLDLKFSILKLVNLLEKYILHKVSQSPESDKFDSNLIENFIGDSLLNLHIVRCTNSAELMLTLHSLENLISADPNISTIMIDSISAFYWVDRMNGGDSVIAQEANMKLVTDILTKLVNTYSLILFATKAAVFKKKGQETSAESEYRTELKQEKSLQNEDLDLQHAEFMCKPWQKFISHRLVLVKELQTNKDRLSFIIGGDCAHGNRAFHVTQAGIQFI